jgi:hypothetical protein
MTSFLKAFLVRKLETLYRDKYRINVLISTFTFKGIKITLSKEGKEGKDSEEVTIKFKSINHENPRLEHKARVYETLTSSLGILFVYYFRTFESYKYIVIDLLGLSLEDLYNFCDHKFTLKTILLLTN